MPSFTSNSNSRIPEAPQWRMMALSMFILFLLLAGFESYFRSRGFEPSIPDSEVLWAYHRARAADDNGKQKIAVIGTSRAQNGLDPKVIESELNGDVIFLPLFASSPYEALWDLLNDDRFKGTIICDMLPGYLLPDAMPGHIGEKVSHYHNEYEKSTLRRLYTRFILHPSLSINANLVILHPSFNVGTMAQCLIGTKSWDSLFAVKMNRSRYRPGSISIGL